jgi:hypothetical protein
MRLRGESGRERGEKDAPLVLRSSLMRRGCGEY